MTRRNLAFATLFLAGCSEPEKPADPPCPAWVLEADRDLVGPGGAGAVDIEIDWFEQTPPDPVAIDGLKIVAARECRGKEVHVRLDTAIPKERWKKCRADRIETVVEECFGAREPVPGVALVHILYCPVNPWTGTDNPDGLASNGLCRRLEKPFPHWQIFIFKGTLTSRAVLGLTPGVLDRSCLVHEFGHALGLVANPAHRFEEGGGHCTDTGCAMTKPKVKAILDNAIQAAVTGEIPWDYCDKCRADLEAARREYLKRR